MGNMRNLALPLEPRAEPADRPATMKIGLVVLALVIFAVGALGAFAKPKYDWDLVAYVGLIKEQRHDTAAEIHATTYETVDARGRDVQALSAAEPPVRANLGDHLLKDHQRLDHLAAHYLGDANGFWRLAEHNGALLPDAALRGGSIRIPQEE